MVAAASAREVPIPVYAEMSSINPVFVFPSALGDRAAELGRAYIASMIHRRRPVVYQPRSCLPRRCPRCGRIRPGCHRRCGRIACRTDAVPGTGRGILARGRAVRREHWCHRRSPRGRRHIDCLQGPPRLIRHDRRRFPRRSRHSGGGLRPGIGDRARRRRRSTGGDRRPPRRSAHRGDSRDINRLFRDSPAARAARITRRADRCSTAGPPESRSGMLSIHGGPFPATSAPSSTSVGSRAIERFLRPVVLPERA